MMIRIIGLIMKGYSSFSDKATKTLMDIFQGDFSNFTFFMIWRSIPTFGSQVSAQSQSFSFGATCPDLAQGQG